MKVRLVGSDVDGSWHEVEEPPPAEIWVDLEPVGLPGHTRALFRLIDEAGPPAYQYVERYPGATS